LETAIQIVVSGLTLGAMYAISAIGLTLLWGALNVLNMAHGAFLVVGGYAAYTASVSFGFPFYVSAFLALVVGGMVGFIAYVALVRPLRMRGNFETNIIIATVGLALIIENIILRTYGAYPFKQPLGFEGGVLIAQTFVRYQNILIFVSSVILLFIVDRLLRVTPQGRAIRAVADNMPAAQLMGVRVERVYAQVFAVSGVLAAFSGIMLSMITTLAPTMGYDPMIKAFIVCVVAGLGNVRGALFAAFMLGMIEAAVQFFFGVRFGFPVLLLLVIITLIWRPTGLFGQEQQARL
jgi:branched-subunit amino acid ABC-type transport system permease component